MTFGEQNTEKEAHDILSYSFDQGINILDTAEIVSTDSFLPLNYYLIFWFPKFIPIITEVMRKWSI